MSDSEKVTINLRVSRKEKEFLQEIAVLKGQTLSEFLRVIACEKAREILKNDPC